MSEAVRPLGRTEGAGRRRLAGLAVADARYHVHVPGATGTGKTTLLSNMVLADAAAGRGAVVLDPKGDMVTDLLDRLPAAVAGRLVLIDPSERDTPAALNILDGPDPELAADQVVSVFRRIWGAWWGPRMDDILRCACLTLARVPGSTLADIPALLTEPAVRAALAGAASEGDPYLRGFWRWYDALPESGQAAAGPVLSRLRAVLTRRFAADLLGSARSSFDMRKVLDSGGLLLARLPKGQIGDDTARLAGSLVIAKAWQAALGGASVPEGRRPDAALYADECHNFLNLPGALESILDEARGYRLSLVLAHQHLGQLPRELAASVAANARNKVCFTLSPDDARVMARQMGPVLTETDLSHLGLYQAACRLIAGGADTAGFTLRTLPLPRPVPGRADLLRDAARRFGRTREQRRADELRRRHPGGRLARRVPPGVPAGASAGVPPGVLETPAETQPPGMPFPHVRGGSDRPAGKPDSWGQS
ncbi:MAG: type IV secretion system DNA-binding domain-containing protein [Streptosporangiaceae bacterium]